MRNRIVVLSLFFCFSAFWATQAQMISWREPGVSTCYKIDFFNNHLYQSNADGRWDDLGLVNFQDVKFAEVFSNSDGINPVKLEGQTGTFLIMECSGQVYRFSIATKTLKREDLTFSVVLIVKQSNLPGK